MLTYCGDSQKNKYKSRGYHFVKEQSFIYKCHNCGKTTSSVNFIKGTVQHKEYLKNGYKTGQKRCSKSEKQVSSSSLQENQSSKYKR